MPKKPAWSTVWKVLSFLWGLLANTTLKKIFPHLVLTVACEDDLRYAAVSYCWRHLRPSRFFRAPGAYTFAANRHMPRVPAHVLVEDPDELPMLFWQGWRPLWVVAKSGHTPQLYLRFFRWTFRAEDLLAKIVADARQRAHQVGSRFSVIRGSGEGEGERNPPETLLSRDTLGYALDPRWNRLVGWSLEDMGAEVRNPLDRILLHPDVEASVAEVRRWWRARLLFKERGIPWVYGWLLAGPPGCGKSSLSVALAEELGIPLYSLDLGQMSAHRLSWWFTKIRASAPAILLVEDLDRTFVRDKPAHEGIGLDYAVLLNELSGVVANDGIFVIITVNDVAKVDPALFDVSHGSMGFGRRLDRMVVMAPPTIDQRRELARRILLGEDESVIDEIVASGASDSFKEFTSRCSERALRSLLG